MFDVILSLNRFSGCIVCFIGVIHGSCSCSFLSYAIEVTFLDALFFFVVLGMHDNVELNLDS